MRGNPKPQKMESSQAHLHHGLQRVAAQLGQLVARGAACRARGGKQLQVGWLCGAVRDGSGAGRKAGHVSSLAQATKAQARQGRAGQGRPPDSHWSCGRKKGRCGSPPRSDFHT